MTLREVAHAAQQHLQTQTAVGVVKRSHVHELLAAAFGAQSWAAFLYDSLLADAGAGDPPAADVAHVVGRALQLGYAQAAAVQASSALLQFAAERQLSRVRWVAIAALLTPPTSHRQDEPPSDEDVEPWDADGAELDVTRSMRDRLLASPLLLDALERVASSLSPQRHFAVASLFRCPRPNPYLYEESLKGRVLSAAERAWVDDYLRMEPIFRRYEWHLRAAALRGERPAAVEYAAAFESMEFFDIAERLTGDVDAERMAQLAPTGQAKARWLQAAAGQGSESALRQLAGEGDLSALERLAARGDLRAMRSAAELALERRDSVRAWSWQYLAKLHGSDFTKSTLHAYHDGGPQHGQFYDSDFGGALFVDGEEALNLPTMNRTLHRQAKESAQKIFAEAPPGHV